MWRRQKMDTKRYFLLAFGFVALLVPQDAVAQFKKVKSSVAGQSSEASKSANRPNILFIMSDDHTSQAWGIYGGILKDYVHQAEQPYLRVNIVM